MLYYISGYIYVTPTSPHLASVLTPHSHTYPLVLIPGNHFTPHFTLEVSFLFLDTLDFSSHFSLGFLDVMIQTYLSMTDTHQKLVISSPRISLHFYVMSLFFLPGTNISFPEFGIYVDRIMSCTRIQFNTICNGHLSFVAA